MCISVPLTLVLVLKLFSVSLSYVGVASIPLAEKLLLFESDTRNGNAPKVCFKNAFSYRYSVCTHSCDAFVLG